MLTRLSCAAVAVFTLAHAPPPDSGYQAIILKIPLCLTCLPSCHHTPSEAPDLRSAFPRHSALPGFSYPPLNTPCPLLQVRIATPTTCHFRAASTTSLTPLSSLFSVTVPYSAPLCIPFPCPSHVSQATPRQTPRLIVFVLATFFLHYA